MKKENLKRMLALAVESIIDEANYSPTKLYAKISELNQIYVKDIHKEAVPLKSYDDLLEKRFFNNSLHEFNYLAKALREKILDKPFGVARWEVSEHPVPPQDYLFACSTSYLQQEGPILKDAYKRVFEFFGIPEFNSITLTSYNWKYELNSTFVDKYLSETDIRIAKRQSDTYTRILFPKFKDEKKINLECFIKLFENQYRGPEYKEVVKGIRDGKYGYFYEENQNNGWTEHELIEGIVDIDSFDLKMVDLRITGFNIVIKTRDKKVVELYNKGNKENN